MSYKDGVIKKIDMHSTVNLKSAEHKLAEKEGRCVLGVFRDKSGQAWSAYWERQFPGCFISGQGGTIWHYVQASKALADKFLGKVN